MSNDTAPDEEVIDPFAGIVDDPDPGPAGTRSTLLASALRGYVPLRKVFVQRPNTEVGARASLLSALVGGRQHRALDAFLLVHALQPVLPGTPLALRTWARLLSTRTHCSPNAASKAFSTLVDLNLLTRTGSARRPILEPLLEDGSGTPWTRAGLPGEEGPGYFTLPHQYWTQGFADILTLPGKAMLLIMLAETQTLTKTAFNMPVERAQEWYGISERTAERGYGELRQAGVLLVKIRKIADPRHPAGRREEYWRALDAPFGTADRSRLQQAAGKAVKARTARAEPIDAGTDLLSLLGPVEPFQNPGPPGGRPRQAVPPPAA